MTDTKEVRLTFGGVLAALPLAVLALVYIISSTAYVAEQLWRWYAVPLDLPAIGRQSFVGAALLLSLFRSKYPRPEPADARPQSEQIVALLFFWLAPWILLALGWAYK